MNTAPPDRLQTACPHCGKRFATARTNEGKRARCPGCSQAFVIAAADEVAPAAMVTDAPDPAAPPANVVSHTTAAVSHTAAAVSRAGPAPAKPPSPAPAEPPAPDPADIPASVPASAAALADGRLCAICQSPFAADEAACTCPDCSSPYHQECWDYNLGCAVYGCEQTPITEGLSDLEVPAAHWGKEEKECPRCKKTILAAATRCRHCGATFSSAMPQGSTSYQAQQRAQAKVPAVRTFSIWLLVFSLLTCTAPLAAIVGPIWYYSNRETIRRLPTLNAAMCRIAVGVAIFQTAIVVLLAAAHALLSA